jgi:hypothetical protein
MPTYFRTLILLGFCVVVSVPAFVFAGPIVRSGDVVSVDANQILEGDFYGLGGSVTISGSSSHDVYVAGGSVTINGDVEGDLTILGGVVQVHGEVKDDVRIIGGEVLLAKPVGGDVVSLAGNLKILSTASVAGDVLFIGNEVLLEGDVLGSVHGTSENTRINAKVGGDVSVRAAQRFTLGDKADISGNVSYKSVTDIERAQNAVVGGTVRKDGFISEPSNTQSAQLIVMRILILLFATLSLFLIARPALERLTTETTMHYGKQGLIGLGVFVVTPVIALLLMTSVLGILIGFMLFFGYLLLLMLSWVVSCIMLGAFIHRSMKRKGDSVNLISVVVGTFTFGLLPLVPLIGIISLLALSLIVLGGLALSFYKQFR